VPIHELFSRPFVFLDGGMGTMLQRHGLSAGEHPERFNLTAPDTVAAVHRAYLQAGSDIIYSNTFGASARKLSGSGLTPADVIPAAVRLAREVAAEYGACVALDVGPIGELMEPNGTLSFDEAYALFQEQILLGTEAGADLIVIETMTDLAEMRAAVLAAKENCSLPVFATMSFEEGGRTFTGTSAIAMAEVLTGLGVDALGVNCSLGPKQLLPIIRAIGSVTDKPLIVKANAGLPDAKTGNYLLRAGDFAEQMALFADEGVQFLGGCCGTNPDFIRALKAAFSDKTRIERTVDYTSRVCSSTKVVPVDRVCVIGERINPTGKKRFQQALRDGDLDYVLSQGVQQADAGADILDVNVGLPGIDEAATMQRVVCSLQGVVDLPLQIDSGNPAVIEAGLRHYAGKAIVNSVNGDEATLNAILPIVKKYGAAVVGLTMDEHGIPESAEARFAIAQRILSAALAHGIPARDVYIDCLTLTLSAQQSAAQQTLRAVGMVRQQLGLHTVLGVSNISFGLPNRGLINRTFLAQAVAAGLDLPILNPNDTAMMDTLAACRALDGSDPDCAEYLTRFTNAPVEAAQSAQVLPDLSSAVIRGLKAEAREQTKLLLAQHEPMHIIDEILVPALDLVGARYEKGELFLPQLLKAAEASQEAFEVLREHMLNTSEAGVSKGKIVLATVQGDIHDIGKNIVKTLLSNYGYTVIDLGRDVAPETILQTAQREDAGLVGLSALMTTTLGSMENTIRLLREAGCGCPVMVGGAVLTPEYAAEIGAEYYAKDAKQAVEIAKLVFAGGVK